MGSRLLQMTEWAYTGDPVADAHRAELAQLPVAWWRQWFAKHDDALTWHLCKGLLQIAADSVDDHPARAVEAADFVLEHADGIALPLELANWTLLRDVLRGEAWLERGNALHEQCDLFAAREAFQRAETIFAALAAPLDLERARRGLALVLHTHRYSAQALALLDAGIAFFRAKQDLPELTRSLLCRGTFLLDSGDGDARPPLEEALALARDLGDTRTEARVLLRLAQDEANAGDGPAAVRLLHDAGRHFLAHGMKSDLERVRWSLADLLTSSGAHDEAAAQLLHVTAAFVAAGLHRDAALSSLEYLRLLSRTPNPLDLYPVARHLTLFFATRGMEVEAKATWSALQQG